MHVIGICFSRYLLNGLFPASVLYLNGLRKSVPCAMIASSEQCRRHVSGSAAAISSFSDDGVVKAVLKELKNVGVAKGKIKAPLVSRLPRRRIVRSVLLLDCCLSV